MLIIRDEEGPIALTGFLPQLAGVEAAIAAPALYERCKRLERYIERMLGHPSAEVFKALASRDPSQLTEDLRLQLLREAHRMMPEATKLARRGKPATLRLIHRIIEPKSRS
ncbi:MAG: hypothetical protein KGL59_12240 [Acidobacteriota bacterium]|nr:hypothetical protein [Acidobacteriota bacterium]